MNDPAQAKVCLSIAGSDPSGGAGILADIKTFQSFGCYGAAAVTSITFQNTAGVFGALHQSAETLRKQLEPIFNDFEVDAIKTGMLPTAEIIITSAKLIGSSGVRCIVVDPVVRSTSGFDLIDDDALSVLVAELFPLALVITPNIPEAERITDIQIKSVEDIKRAGERMLLLGAKNVLIKGGHFKDEKAVDYLFGANEMMTFEAERIDTAATHGTGCTLSAAIAANLALGSDLKESIAAAKKYVTDAIRTAPMIGRGHSPINHLIRPE
jgi:hydroxymethylpyrimidine kinase/phosphomethylpyrimidine kinase